MSTFRDFKAKNKLKVSNKDSPFIEIGGSESIGNASIEATLKQAKKSGILNLANRGLSVVPTTVYRINTASTDTSADRVDFDKGGDSWWEEVFLTKLILTSNQLTCLSSDVRLLSKLTYLDLSDNKLTTLPREICDLAELRYFNCSKNAISSLPSDFKLLKSLQDFLIAYNNLDKLPIGLMDLSNLDTLDVSHNKLIQFPTDIDNLLLLKKIDFSYNCLSSMPCTMQKLKDLKSLNLSYNKISHFSERFSAPIQHLDLQVNSLTVFPINSAHDNLKELLLSHNQIRILSSDHLSYIPNICTLVLANNKLLEIPNGICNLTKLVNLNVSNNDLKTLPLTLGDMEKLQTIAIEGNPFRMIKRSVVTGGAEQIKKYLRMRNTESDKDIVEMTPGMQALNRATISPGDVAFIDLNDFKTTGILKLSSQGFSDLPNNIFDLFQITKPKSILLNNNKFYSFPMRLMEIAESISEINIGQNSIEMLPDSIGQFKMLQRLDVSNNKMTKLPDALGALTKLSYLNLSNNPIGPEIPYIVYNSSQLEVLHLSHCGIEVIDSKKIRDMTRLEVLNISNNELKTVPPELGLCEHLRMLSLEGNRFKVPRAEILARGTAAILEYLRSRIAA